MARVWNNVTNLELLKNRTILQLLKNQDDLLKEFALEIDRIEGVANTAVGTANNALSVATTARAESTEALQTAQAANSKSDEAKADAAAAKTAAQNAANAAVAAQGSAAAAENSAGQAANSAAAAAADAAKVNQLETKVNKNTSDISTINEDLAASRLDIDAIEAREAGYGKSLSISGNSLSLMHDSNILSTITIPGGGGSTGLPAPVEMTGWSTTMGPDGVGNASLTGCYSIKLNQKSYLIYGGRLSAVGELLNGNQSVAIIPPDELGNVSFAAGWAHSATTVVSGAGRYLQIATNVSGVAGQLRVVGNTASPGGLTTYTNEFLDSFMAIVTFA